MRSSPTSISEATGSSAPDLTSRALRYERAIIAGSVGALSALCWCYITAGASLGASSGMAMAQPPFAALVVMWWLMMAAMMLPSATPAILLYARVREARSGEPRIAATWLFLAGYLAIWLLFSLIAACAQTLIGTTAVGSRYAQAMLLIAAGIYQLSPLKAACLGQCRSPAQFISRHWRAGRAGAVRLGLLHGAYCVGCCWMLMALLFVGGVMNLWWVVALTLLIALEKLVNAGQLLARATGLALVASGLAIFFV